MFRKVRDAVLASTGGRQEPSVYGSLSSRGAYLTARPVLPDSLSSTDLLADSQSATDRLAAELLYWESVKDSEEAAELHAYLDRYPSGAYEALARIRLKRLEGASDGSEPPESTGSAAPAQEAFSVPVPGPESVESSLEPSRAERRWIQERLAALGFDPGPTDGLFGHGTRETIGRWQSSQGEPATGYLDAEAAKALLAAAEERKRPERERASREPGRSFRDCPVCPVMVVVPAGSFMMGSPPSEADRHADEGPVHRVTISEPLAVGVYEVTFSEWEACVRGGGCGGYRPADSGWGRGNRPVINVSWKDASAYAEWLSRKTGKRYRLLSESE